MNLVTYLKETRAELKHVSWPTKEQSFWLTLAVILISLFIAGYLGFFDWIFLNIIELKV